jgi:hypothetical protein
MNMQLIEHASLAAQRPLWAGAIQLTVGYLSVLAWSRLIAAQGPGWTLFVFFLFVLLALRLVPAVLRRLMPFSRSVQAKWAERRVLAKRFDSYQWQKLFWMGLGTALYVLQSGERLGALLTLMFICLSSGAVGLAIWRHRAAQMEPLNAQATLAR